MSETVSNRGASASPVAPDPLPRTWMLGEPDLSGRIKARAEDFLVDEIPLYEPSGEGEHLYLRVQKRHMAHGELIDLLARHYEVDPGAIGFAGMKDRVGVTQQTVSIHLPGRSDPPPPSDTRIEILWQARHGNKLRRGHLQGNRFAIRVREVDPLKVTSVWRRLSRLATTGVPDFFGPQRFGYRCNSHVLGRLLLGASPEALLSELLGAGGSPFPEHQRPAREHFDQGKWAESLPLWHRGDYAERAALAALVRGATPARAISAIRREDRAFWVSALQSAIFNQVVAERVRAGTLGEIHHGDVAWLHDNGAVFLVGEEDLAERDEGRAIAPRLAAFELSPSGPLPGPGMVAATGRAGECEREAMLRFGGEVLMSAAPDGPQGARRPLRVRVGHPSVEGSMDEHGPFIRLAFDLPKGAYATVVLRELFRDAESGAHDEP
ncbi:MAG: tRNA pseudouridine(13) synthase TruD [Phycisphaeraceae bacterium]|nr:tRNA pseudouridine(13) synthase TruD [Phycisphaeraceae bacterium]